MATTTKRQLAEKTEEVEIMGWLRRAEQVSQREAARSERDTKALEIVEAKKRSTQGWLYLAPDAFEGSIAI